MVLNFQYDLIIKHYLLDVHSHIILIEQCDQRVDAMKPLIQTT